MLIGHFDSDCHFSDRQFMVSFLLVHSKGSVLLTDKNELSFATSSESHLGLAFFGKHAKDRQPCGKHPNILSFCGAIWWTVVHLLDFVMCSKSILSHQYHAVDPWLKRSGFCRWCAGCWTPTSVESMGWHRRCEGLGLRLRFALGVFVGIPMRSHQLQIKYHCLPEKRESQFSMGSTSDIINGVMPDTFSDKT